MRCQHCFFPLDTPLLCRVCGSDATASVTSEQLAAVLSGWLRAARQDNFRQARLHDFVELSTVLAMRGAPVEGIDLRGLTGLFGSDATDLGAGLALGCNLLRLGYAEQTLGLLRKLVGRWLARLHPADIGPFEATWGNNTFRLSLADEAGTYLDLRVAGTAFVPVASLGQPCRLLTAAATLPALQPADVGALIEQLCRQTAALSAQLQRDDSQLPSLRAAWSEMQEACMRSLDGVPRVGAVAARLHSHAMARHRAFFSEADAEATICEMRAEVGTAIAPLMTCWTEVAQQHASAIAEATEAALRAALDDEAARLRLERQRALPHAERAVRQADTALRTLLGHLRRRSRQVWWWFTPRSSLLETAELSAQLYGALFESESLRLGNALLDLLIESSELRVEAALTQRRLLEERRVLLESMSRALGSEAGAKFEAEQAAQEPAMSACERTP